MWPLYVLGMMMIGAIAVALAFTVAAYRRRVRYAALLREWQSTSARNADGSSRGTGESPHGTGESSVRRSSLVAVQANGRSQPLVWYLSGVEELRRGRTRQAARAFGAAHHGNPNFETAALLTFACLKAREGEDSDLLEQIVQTWHELKRPNVAAHAEDRLMADALIAGEDPPHALSALGRLAWAVSSPEQRRRMERLLEDESCPWSRPLQQAGSRSL